VDRATGTSDLVGISITDGTISWLSDVDAGLVDRVVDLAAEITADKPAAEVGDTVVFTGTVTNVGTVAVHGAAVTITIPDGLRIESVAGDGWTCEVSGQEIHCVTGQVLQPGESAPPIMVITTATTTIPNTDAIMVVSLADGSLDDNPDNDRAVAVVAVVAVTVEPADLAATGAEVISQLIIGLLILFGGLGAVLATKRGKGKPRFRVARPWRRRG
jgi:uncharacterized repeat protein (TIGR01451 family)